MDARSKHTARTWLTCYAEPSDNFQRPIEIVFTYLPGAPAQGPSYASGGQPAEPAEISIEAIYFIGDDEIDVGSESQYAPLPGWMVEKLSSDSLVFDWLCREAEEDRIAVADDRAEMKADEARGN
jgi:hypothetical protein